MKRIQTTLAACAVGVTTATPAGADWSYTVAPYLWASGINGTEGIAGRELEVDASFGDLLEVLDIGFALHFEAQNPQWGWFGDVFYAKLSDEKNLPVSSLGGDTKQTIVEGGFSYPFGNGLEGLAGLRYQRSDTTVVLGGVGSTAVEEDWVDGFVGLRWTPVKTDQWMVSLRGDVGAGGSDLVWLASATVGYRFNKAWSAFLGYRYLDTDYESDGFKWDIAQSGLGLGVGYSW